MVVFCFVFLILSGGMRWMLILKPHISSEWLTYLFSLHSSSLLSVASSERSITGVYQKLPDSSIYRSTWNLGEVLAHSGRGSWQHRNLRGNALHARKMRGKKTETSQSPEVCAASASLQRQAQKNWLWWQTRHHNWDQTILVHTVKWPRASSCWGTQNLPCKMSWFWKRNGPQPLQK